MTQDDRIRLEAGWKDALREEFDKSPTWSNSVPF